MAETGGSIFIALSLAIMLMALLPVCILFIRKIPLQTVFNVLNILCLFVFLRHLLLILVQQPGSLFIQTGLRLAEFTLAFYLLKLLIISGRKDLMNMVLVSFLSVVITIYALKGMGAYTKAITVIEAIVLTALSFTVLIQSISNRPISLVDEPVFWIAGGLLCYYGMVLFMELITAYDSGLSQQIQQQKNMVLMGTEVIQMAFFTVGAMFVSKDNGQ